MSDLEAQVDELLRVNAELAAEISDLRAGRIDEPRSAAMPTARRLGRLIEERDTLLAELENAHAQLEVLKPNDQALREQIHQQHLHIEQQSVEIVSLRAGLAGVLRRLRARLLHRPRG
jgi:cell division protein FtsB